MNEYFPKITSRFGRNQGGLNKPEQLSAAQRDSLQCCKSFFPDRVMIRKASSEHRPSTVILHYTLIVLYMRN